MMWTPVVGVDTTFDFSCDMMCYRPTWACIAHKVHLVFARHYNQSMFYYIFHIHITPALGFDVRKMRSCSWIAIACAFFSSSIELRPFYCTTVACVRCELTAALNYVLYLPTINYVYYGVTRAIIMSVIAIEWDRRNVRDWLMSRRSCLVCAKHTHTRLHSYKTTNIIV